MAIALLIFAEIGFTLAAALLKGPIYLRIVCIVNMMTIAVLAPAMVVIFGYESNIGNFLYATTLLAFALCYEKCGYDEALQALYSVLFAITLRAVLFLAVDLLPVVNGNEVYRRLFHALTGPALTTTTISYFAFFFASVIFLRTARHFQGRGVFVQYGVSIALAQIADSLIFFPLVFQHDFFGLMLTGYVFKVGFVLLTLPVMYGLRWYFKSHSDVVCGGCPKAIATSSPYVTFEDRALHDAK